MLEQKHIIIIGAGAAGLMAAISAAREGCRVTVLERTARAGRKIEMTGNGKCNYTNEYQNMNCYHSPDREYVEHILNCFTYEQTLAFFKELGIVPRCKNGYYYPYSGQAQAVSYALRTEAERLHVKLACNIQIHRIESSKGRFLVHTDGYVYEADAVILAAGSKAAPATGSDGSGYILAGKLGHHIRKPLPALVQLLSRDRKIALLAGVRCEASAKLFIDDTLCGAEQGELQFVKNGLSGIPVFQLSGQAVRALEEGHRAELRINFLTRTGWEDILKELEIRKAQFADASVHTFLNGLIHERVQKAVLEQTGCKGGVLLRNLDKQQWQALVDALCSMRFLIHDSNGFEQAQVCTGGVSFSQLKKWTLESSIHPQLYFAGEILDVDGICGGYNLQWAWASGYVAGKQAVRRLKK